MNLILILGFVQRPRKKEVVVPLGAVFAAEWPHQQKWKDDHFQRAPAMRSPHIQALAGWTASQKIESGMRHGTEFRLGMLTCQSFEVNPGGAQSFYFRCANAPVTIWRLAE
jgi:hypothetical protein